MGCEKIPSNLDVQREKIIDAKDLKSSENDTRPLQDVIALHISIPPPGRQVKKASGARIFGF